jgi:hypothetical protein
MKTLLAIVATLAITSAQAEVIEAEVIYSKPNSITKWTSPRPFKTIFTGGPPESDKAEHLSPVVANPFGSTTTLYLITRQPYEHATVGAADFVVLDNDDKVIKQLRVIITPTGEPMRSVQMTGGGRWCHGMNCWPTTRPKETSAEEVTIHRDGSVTHRKEY